MTLASQIAADLDTVFFNTDDFAVTVSDTHAGGSAKSIKALIDYGEGSPMEGMDALNTDAMMEIKASDVAVVSVGDSVVIGSGTWNVIFAKLIDDGLIWRCNISRINR